MMKVTEYDIEKYVRFPELLTAEESERVKKHIEQHAQAKEIAGWFRDFYSEFDKIERPVEFKMKVFKTKSGYSGPLVLAADTSSKDSQDLVTKVTYSSEEGTLVRILEDVSKSEYQFHVLSRYLAEEDRVLLNFEHADLEVITEKGGKLRYVESQKLSNINWNSMALVLRLPSSTCSYDPASETARFVLCDECSMSIEHGTCLFHTSETHIHRILFEQGEVAELMYLESGAASFRADEEQPFKVYLYT